MTHAGALDINIDAVRERYSAAIDAYRDTALHLQRQRPAIAASAFGEGFAPEGQRVVEALEALHETSVRFLAARGERTGSRCSCLATLRWPPTSTPPTPCGSPTG